MATPYKHNCSICGKVYFSFVRSHNICSKDCRSAIKKKEKGSCEVCGWSLTIDNHHEGGKTYLLCPNHHALLTRGIYNIQELFVSEEVVNKKIIEIKEREKVWLMLKYEKEIRSKEEMEKEENFLNTIRNGGLTEFTYYDLQNIFKYNLQWIKKRVQQYIETNKIQYVTKGGVGRGKTSKFTISAVSLNNL